MGGLVHFSIFVAGMYGIARYKNVLQGYMTSLCINTIYWYSYAEIYLKKIISDYIPILDNKDKHRCRLYHIKDGKTVKRTSYNTFAGEHALDGTPFRGNYGTVGFIYYAEQDMFLPPKPFDSWVEDFDNFYWKAPIDKPNDTDNFGWVEDDYQDDNTTGWLLIEEPEDGE